MRWPLAITHYTPNSRVHNTRHLAQTIWPTLGERALTIPITKGPIEGGYRGAYYPATDTIRIQPRNTWNTYELCGILLHELSHAAHYQPPPDQIYIRPDGTIDAAHNNNPAHLMHPNAPGYAGCHQLNG